MVILEININMGIKDYHKWIRDVYSCSISDFWMDSYEHLYIDINFALHYTCYGTNSTGEIMDRLFYFIDNLIKKFNPTVSVTLADDGAAPMAKLLLQRKRRSTIFDNYNVAFAFTPGTTFMDDLKTSLIDHMKILQHEYKFKVNYMLGCDGEGELKIKRKLTETINIYPNDTHIVVSSDADMIVMCGTLPRSSYYRVFIYSNIKSHEIISFGKLIYAHVQAVGMSKNFGYDFTFLSILLGNDYLPKILYVDVYKIWESYKITCKDDKCGIINDTCTGINKQFLISVLNNLMGKINTKSLKKIKFDTIKTNKYMYENYVDGVLWCFDMYNSGYCSQNNYMFEFEDSPHLIGVILFIIYNDKFVFDTSIQSCVPKLLYPILVLPKSGISLIHNKYHKFAHTYSWITCDICTNLTNMLSSCNDNTNEEYTKTLSHFKHHSNTHIEMTKDDILEIIDKFNSEFC